jgi:hypothetical protein
MILAKNVKVQTRKEQSRRSAEHFWNDGTAKLEYRYVALEGEITVTIDLEAIIKHLGPKAVRAATKRAQEASGMLVVTATNVQQTSISDWAKL